MVSGGDGDTLRVNIGGREVTIEVHATDRYGRTVAEVISDHNINLRMVEGGITRPWSSDGAAPGPHRSRQHSGWESVRIAGPLNSKCDRSGVGAMPASLSSRSSSSTRTLLLRGWSR